MKPMIIVTNNPKVKMELGHVFEVHFVEEGILDVFRYVRNLVHAGHEMLSHPLSGSVKPGETLYKSVLVSKEKSSLHMDSLLILEEANQLATHLIEKGHERPMDDKIKEDLQFIDLTLIRSAIF